MKKYNTVIIGGGPAGYTAALYAARAGLSVIVLEMLSPGGQMATTTEIDNYPGFEETVDGFDLAQKMKAGAERFGVESEFAEVTEIDLQSDIKTIKTTSGDFEADTVILATGAAPRELGVEGERELRGRGVSYCATCDGMMYRNKTVVVVGGGNSAAEDALYLSKLCAKVYMVHRRDKLRASVSYQRQLEKTENVEFIWNSEVTALLHDNIITGAEITNRLTGEKSKMRRKIPDAMNIIPHIGRKIKDFSAAWEDPGKTGLTAGRWPRSPPAHPWAGGPPGRRSGRGRAPGRTGRRPRSWRRSRSYR